MKNKVLYLVFPIIALILEILPFGAVCNFANPEGEPFRKTFSYFDLVPFGYANFAPFLTAITTCCILVLLIAHIITQKKFLMTIIRITVCIGVILSLCPLLYGISFFSIVGGLITAALIAEFIIIVI